MNTTPYPRVGACCAQMALYSDEVRLVQQPESFVDGAKVLDMLIEVGWLLGWKRQGAYRLFTCRHFDPDSGDCGIYDDRPQLCRDFPDGEPCEFAGCSCAGDCRGGAPPPPVTSCQGRKRLVVFHPRPFRLATDGLFGGPKP